MQLLVLMVPVIFAFMGFAIDLGRLYLVRGEIKAAANAMALTAAAKLNGTDIATDSAAAVLRLPVNANGGSANKYDYGSLLIGESNGQLASEIREPAYFETTAEAVEAGQGAGSSAGGAAAKHVRVEISAEAPLIFWRFLPFIQEPQTVLRVDAVAGLSAPLCTACGIESIAIAAIDTSDEVNFGFTAATRYTLGYVCNGNNPPGPLPGTTQRIPYLLINRLNPDATVFAEDSTQAYRIGGQGLPPNASEALACVAINSVEAIWETATSLTCAENRVPGAVTAFMCGMASRFESGVPAGCENITDIDTAGGSYVPDTDTADVEDYLAYAGSGRRVITVAIVDSLGSPTAMTVLGFRQFLLEPNLNQTNLNPVDQGGRFPALYLGNPAPLRGGRISGCTITTGPGKVVLHK